MNTSLGGRAGHGGAWRALLVVAGVAAGSAAAALAAGAVAGMPARDLSRLALLLLPGAIATLLWTAAAPRLLAGVSMRTRFVVVAVVGVTVALSTLGVVAALMFVSDHDAALVAVMLVYSGIVGVTAALAASRASLAAIDRLGATAASLGAGNLQARAGRVGADLELDRLARRLDEMAAQLEASLAREREIESSRRDLMTAVSHDLRTPLASLRAMVEAVDEGVVSDLPSLRRYAGEMRRSVRSLTQLVDDLFELARVDAGAIERETERVRLGDVVRSAVAEFEVAAGAKGLSLETALQDAAGALCSPRLLRVLQNLLQNAIRHTPADGTVRIEASRETDGLTVAVEDTGEGIAPEALDRVFEPFWQGDPARSSDGSGLGLALAKRIVEALGGRVEVQSVLSRGSRFAVWVPEAPLPGR